MSEEGRIDYGPMDIEDGESKRKVYPAKYPSPEPPEPNSPKEQRWNLIRGEEILD